MRQVGHEGAVKLTSLYVRVHLAFQMLHLALEGRSVKAESCNKVREDGRFAFASYD